MGSSTSQPAGPPPRRQQEYGRPPVRVYTRRWPDQPGYGPPAGYVGQNGYGAQYPQPGGGVGAPRYPPAPAPAPEPQTQRTVTVKNLANVNPRSLEVEEVGPGGAPTEGGGMLRVKFKFDALSEGKATVHVLGAVQYGADEAEAPRVVSRVGSSTPAPFATNLGQTFVQADGFIDTGAVREADLTGVREEGGHGPRYPVVICMECTDAEGRPQSQTTFASLVKKSGDGWGIKVLKQTIYKAGETYELHEIYGLSGDGDDDDGSGDGGRDCIICMSEPRDTTVLPCRHMCMCSDCAKVLRFQTNKCPVCRTTVESLLQIKEVSRAVAPVAAAATS